MQEWGSQIMDTRRSMDSTVSILPAGNPPLSFSDVSLGVLIRVVPGGLLYRGTWNGEAVSVKVSPGVIRSHMSGLVRLG